jgi:DNA-binding NtrC family response regulator
MKLVSSRPASQVGTSLEPTDLVVASRAMTELLGMARSAAESPAPILITGESGVGKNVVARYIHGESRRKLAPFVGLNCAGLTDARLESELFGHAHGRLTVVGPERRGKLQLANGGTLFLDQVGDMILPMQAWLLRFLQNGEIQDIGSDQPQGRVDVRVVAATNRNLDDLVAAGQFRQDLLYRLRVIHLHVPPLRERADDVRALMRSFFALAKRELNFTDDALQALLSYQWPGNVRELRNVVEQLVWLSAGRVVEVEQLPVSIC